ncbi:TerC family protein [Paenibacillus sp. J2TS4]|uniref:TerC family protein n=1 Tax=Paenibacillus sp. J2TS4 TaxID=2807194 RepID=UPI001B1DCA3B|nr:TerC family protein [Paenibacillus sp. J2TS4]GIP33847.1 membrane protein [Paenibacillus sp. J2TS4]
MDFLSITFLIALINIIIIDLVLAGDNAIVIGLAARNVPKEMQKKVIIIGTLGAVIIRASATLAVTWLLKFPGLLLVGGILLIWIAYKLLVDNKDHELKAKTSIWGAISTILIADTVMGLDNVLAIAGAAHGNYLLVIIGLLISVPIMIWGSTLFLRLMTRFPWIIYIGSGVLAFTAAKMITDEPFVHNLLFVSPIAKWAFVVIVIVVVLMLGLRKNRTQNSPSPAGH